MAARKLAQENKALKSQIGDLIFENKIMEKIMEMNKDEAIEEKEALESERDELKSQLEATEKLNEKEQWEMKLQLDAADRLDDLAMEDKEALVLERDELKTQLKASKKLNMALRKENSGLEGKLQRALTEIEGQKRKIKNLDGQHRAENKIWKVQRVERMGCEAFMGRKAWKMIVDGGKKMLAERGRGGKGGGMHKSVERLMKKEGKNKGSEMWKKKVEKKKVGGKWKKSGLRQSSGLVNLRGLGHYMAKGGKSSGVGFVG